MITPPSYLLLLLERDHPVTTKPAQFEVRSMAKSEQRRMEKQIFQKWILALDPHAEFSVDGNPLTVIHSRCRGKSTQKAINDTSNFREHVGICQGPPISSDGRGFQESSLQGGRVPPNHPATARPIQLSCPGFSFKEIFGRDYGSLSGYERGQVTRVADLGWLDFKEGSSVFSKSCLKQSPSHQEPAHPCRNCSKLLEPTGLKGALCRKTSKPDPERYSPFRKIDIKTVGVGDNQEYANVSQSCDPPYPTFVDNAPLGERLALISKITSWYAEVRGGTRRYPGYALSFRVPSSITQPKSSQKHTKKMVREGTRVGACTILLMSCHILCMVSQLSSWGGVDDRLFKGLHPSQDQTPTDSE